VSIAQNLAYSVVQVLHNFGAVATVGGSLAAAVSTKANSRRKLAWLSLAGWGTQAVSGAAFGIVSFLFYRRLPDIAGVAMVALLVKILCVATGFLLMAAYLFWRSSWAEERRGVVWYSSAMLSVIALSAAAILRWFS
jgi:hypothetical protein